MLVGSMSPEAKRLERSTGADLTHSVFFSFFSVVVDDETMMSIECCFEFCFV